MKISTISFRIVFPASNVEGFREGWAVEGTRHRLLTLARALTQINVDIWAESEDLPGLYDAGVVYKGEPQGEAWKDYATLLFDGEGDCEDLACARAAELVHLHKVRAAPWISYKRDENGYLYHVRTWRASIDTALPPVSQVDGRPVIVPAPAAIGGWLEDPSLVLGMPS